MRPSDYSILSERAIMFAAIVYALAALGYALEWALARQSASEDDSDTPHTTPEIAGRVGVALTSLAFALQVLGVVTRGLAADRVPWGNMYEFALAGTLGAVAFYLLLLRALHLRWLGLTLTLVTLTTLMIASLTLYVPAAPLVPALQSYWLVIHVTAAIIAVGAFSLGAMTSALFLVQDRRERRVRTSADAPALRNSPGAYSRGGVALRPEGAVVEYDASDGSGAGRRPHGGRLPDAASIDRVTYRIHAFAFPIWTFAALVAGPVWAKYAWGRYWGWDPKEVWAFITWVIYAAYLHSRATAGWKGNKAAAVALLGFATVVFNFVGINIFGSGLHSYGGL